MDNRENIDVLAHAKAEIIVLREQLAVAKIKATAHDTIVSIIGLLSNTSSQGYSMDVIWRINNALDRLQPVEPTDAPASMDPQSVSQVGTDADGNLLPAAGPDAQSYTASLGTQPLPVAEE